MATALQATRNITARSSLLSGRRLPVYASMSSFISPIAARSIARCSYNHSSANVKVWSPRRYLSTNKPGKEPSAASKVASSSGTAAPKNESPSKLGGMIQNFLGAKEMPPRNTPRWYGEMVLLCTVFAITGSSTMVLVRPAVSEGLGLKGSMKDGPWSYRICSIVIMTPIYATLLVGVGTVFGRHHYFRHFSVKMWSRFGIPPEMMDPTFHETKKTFRKW